MIVSNKLGRRPSWKVRALLVLFVLLITPLSLAPCGENRESVAKQDGRAISTEEDQRSAKASSHEHRVDINSSEKKREAWLLGLFSMGGKRIADPAVLSEIRTGRLVVHGPKITDDALKRLTDHAGLQELGLFDTCVIGPGLQHLANLDNLERLVLAGPHVTDAWLAYLPELKGLRRIVISQTNVTNSGIQFLEKYTQLRTLDLRYSSTDDEGLQVLEHLPNLTALYLGETNVGDRGLANLRHVPKVSRLELKHTQVSDEGLANLKHVPNLSYFSLASPHVKGNGTANLKHTQRLQQLQFVGDNVTDEWMRWVPPLKELYWLELHSTSVTSVGLQPIGEWAKLERLYLNRNRSIDDQVVVHLQGLDRLKVLELRETQVTAKGAGQLRKMLPNARVSVMAEPR